MKKIVTAILTFFVLLFPLSALVAAPNIFGNDPGGKGNMTERIAQGAGYNIAVNNLTFAETIGRIIRVVLSIIGVLFFVLIFYAGYLWFMARGDEGEVEKAQSIIKMAVIGLLITFAAFTISVYVVRMVGGATGGSNRVGTTNPQTGGSNQPPFGNACENGKKDLLETDVDCGGGSCRPCTNGRYCSKDTDCESGLCTTAAGASYCTIKFND